MVWAGGYLGEGDLWALTGSVRAHECTHVCWMLPTCCCPMICVRAAASKASDNVEQSHTLF